MPYENEHAARLVDPDSFDSESFRRTNDKFGSGIHAIFGKLKGEDSMTLQAIRFSSDKFTADEAKAWLTDHDYKPILFEPASGKAAKAEISMKHFQGVGKVSDIDRDTRTMVVRISTDAKDRDSEVLPPKGCKLENFRKNPIVLWAHDYKGSAPGSNVIAKALWVKTDKEGVLAKPQFAPHEDAQRVFDLYADGYLNTWSVGFLPVEGKGHRPTEEDVKGRPDWAGAQWIHDEWELLEFSAVPVPANPNALTLAREKGLTLPPPLDATPVPKPVPEVKATPEPDKPVVEGPEPEGPTLEDPMPKSLGRAKAKLPEIGQLGKAKQPANKREIGRLGKAAQPKIKHEVKRVGSIAEIEKTVRARLRGKVMIYD